MSDIKYLSNIIVSGNVTADAHITSGGLSTDFVKGDGSLDSSFTLVTSLIDLTDVSSANTNSGFVLVANGSTFASRALVTADIADWATGVEAYITDVTAIGLLNGTGNWDIDGNYTGVAITGTFQGQKHYNTAYFFEAYDDNLWLRTPRG